jgi:hypothetical protein
VREKRRISCCTYLVYSVEVGFCITAILILPGDLRLQAGQ